MHRGYVSTTAADDRPLMIYYIHKAPDQGALSAEVRVLAEFAAAWTRGERVSRQNDRGITSSKIILTDDCYRM